MKKYESYKESGIEWIGEIPNHWKSTKVKFEILSKGYKAGPFGSSLITSELLLNGTIKVYSPEHVAEKEILEEWYLPDDRAQEMSQFIVNDKDVVLPIVGTLGLARVFHSNRDGIGIINQRLAKISCNSNRLVPEFFCLIMKDVSNYQEYFKLKARGSILSHLNKETIVSMPLVLPDIEEQTIIANYLDHKTTQIENLIAKKEQFIQLLEEERIAVINQAVTKGLEPNVPMKDSGIEWLGEIPEHWEIVRLKYLSRIRYGLGQPPKQKVDGLPIIRATNIFRGIISSNNMLFVDPDDLPMNREPILKENDIIIVRSGAYTADSAIITKEWEGSVTGYDIVLTPLKVNPNLLAFSLLSTYLLDNQLFLERLRAAQPHLNSQEIGNSFFLLPPDEEQISIVQHIEKQMEKILILKERMLLEIELLKEYKTALISEVVTGKVDVREEKLN
jgi:type I restriction enzyme S subunit